jgi:hypothetical protein
MTGYHLAQLNVARALAPLDDPLLAEFTARLDDINALADGSPGFVWRLQSDTGNATDIQATLDPRLLVNLSVWDSPKSLFDYVYRSGHAEVMRRRKDWFEPREGPHLVLWWVPAGELPTVEQALERLDRLREEGPTPAAFTFKQRFPAPDGTGGELSEREAEDARCA